MITNISDRKDTKFLSYNNTLSVEIKFHWQIIAFFLLYRWHSYINNVSLFTLGGNIARRDDFKKNAMPQSIHCTLASAVVVPPSAHGVMWSPSISSRSKWLPHQGQMPPWRS